MDQRTLSLISRPRQQFRAATSLSVPKPRFPPPKLQLSRTMTIGHPRTSNFSSIIWARLMTTHLIFKTTSPAKPKPAVKGKIRDQPLISLRQTLTLINVVSQLSREPQPQQELLQPWQDRRETLEISRPKILVLQNSDRGVKASSA